MYFGSPIVRLPVVTVQCRPELHVIAGSEINNVRVCSGSRGDVSPASAGAVAVLVSGSDSRTLVGPAEGEGRRVRSLPRGHRGHGH